MKNDPMAIRVWLNPFAIYRARFKPWIYDAAPDADELNEITKKARNLYFKNSTMQIALFMVGLGVFMNSAEFFAQKSIFVLSALSVIGFMSLTINFILSVAMMILTLRGSDVSLRDFSIIRDDREYADFAGLVCAEHLSKPVRLYLESMCAAGRVYPTQAELAALKREQNTFIRQFSYSNRSLIERIYHYKFSRNQQGVFVD